jgi:hypothetical protein
LTQLVNEWIINFLLKSGKRKEKLSESFFSKADIVVRFVKRSKFSVVILNPGMVCWHSVILFFWICAKLVSIKFFPKRLLSKSFEIFIWRHFLYQSLFLSNLIHFELNFLELLKFRIVNEIVLVDVLVQGTDLWLEPASEFLQILNSAKVKL